MELQLTGKIIVVAGPANKLGETIAKKLKGEGAVPVMIGDDQEPGNPGKLKQSVILLLDKFEKIDGLINNGETHEVISLKNGSYEAFRTSLHKNVVGYFLLTQLLLPKLKESKGPVVNINDQVPGTSHGAFSGYGGRNALTREWAVDLLKYGIRVNAVMGNITGASHDKTLSTETAIANLVLFLLSPRASHITGQLLSAGV